MKSMERALRATWTAVFGCLFLGIVLAVLPVDPAAALEPFGPNWIIAENQPCQAWNSEPFPGETYTWSGDCVDGKVSGDGRGVFHLPAVIGNFVYEGSMRDGKRHGQGTFTWPDGDRYEGEWRDNIKHGKGIKTWADGSRYEGEWRDDEWHGQGTFTWPNGDRYEGEWRDYEQHGQGIYTWADGSRYEGEWRDDEQHGQGTFTWPDGDRYEGEWRDNIKYGKGIKTWADGSRYEGEWRDDEWHGQGTFTWPDGDRYEGEWRDYEQHGQGIYTWADGSSYEGEWRDNEWPDKGTYISADGDRYEAEYRDGTVYHFERTKVAAQGDGYEGGSRDGKRHGQGPKPVHPKDACSLLDKVVGAAFDDSYYYSVRHVAPPNVIGCNISIGDTAASWSCRWHDDKLRRDQLHHQAKTFVSTLRQCLFKDAVRGSWSQIYYSQLTTRESWTAYRKDEMTLRTSKHCKAREECKMQVEVAAVFSERDMTVTVEFRFRDEPPIDFSGFFGEDELELRF